MGECLSTPDKLVVDPIIEDNFKRNQETSLKQLNQTNRTCASNLSETGTFLAVDSIRHDKGRIELYEAVYLRNWNKASNLIKNTRFMESADYIDRYERTCLHWACVKSAPLPIIQNLIAAYADALLMQDHLGKTPLHLACESGSDSSIYLLLGANSQATLLRDTVNGRTPLAECLFTHRPPSVIDNVLNSNPKSIIIPDNNTNIPTVIYFNTYLGLFISFTGKVKGTWKCCNDNVEDLIEIARLLLRAEIRHLDTSTQESQPQDLNENEDSNILLDSILSPTCPFAFVEFLLSSYPELADVRNMVGDLPIHVVASLTPDSSKMLPQMYKCNGCGEPQSDNAAHYHRRDPKVHFRQSLCHDCIDESQICNYTKSNGGGKIELTIKSLLSMNPAYAQKCNHEDLTPLNIGKIAGHSWDGNSLEEIMDGYNEHTTPVEIESNNERSVTITDLTEPGASEPGASEPASVAHDSISITKNLLEESLSTTDLTFDDHSQASLSSVANDSNFFTETVERCDSIESVTLNTTKEREEAADDSSQVSTDDICQSARTQLDDQIEEKETNSNPPEDKTSTNPSEEKNTDTDKPIPAGGFASSLRSHLTSSQGISSVVEIGIAALL